ncbi:hypothetical protein DNTS_007139 [Danionella cerebrum]|uniref:Uncharacterized protein n=1 Tax=Danionella cerebrum TaxID=2873325 RepID=A0A553NAL1_9TELE|nr:hypothetical protein DNTS_007139 [Danionella translucida]
MSCHLYRRCGSLGLVYDLITLAQVKHAYDDIPSHARCLRLTSPLALIPMAPIRMCCELIDAFVELYGQQRGSKFHPFSYLTKVLGLAALGLAGVTIGAFFTQKISQLHTDLLTPAAVPFKGLHCSDAPQSLGAGTHPLWS